MIRALRLIFRVSTFSGYGEEELVGLVCLSIYILGLSKEEQAMDKQISSWTFEQ